MPYIPDTSKAEGNLVDRYSRQSESSAEVTTSTEGEGKPNIVNLNAIKSLQLTRTFPASA